MKCFYFLIFILILSCSKSSSDSNVTPTKRTELLVGKKWQITEYFRIVENIGTYDSIQFMPEYSKDDYMVFQPSLTYEVYSGVMKAPNDTRDVIGNGTWKFIFSDQHLILNCEGNGCSPISQHNDKQIMDLTSTIMKWQFVNENNSEEYFKMTLKAI